MNLVWDALKIINYFFLSFFCINISGWKNIQKQKEKTEEKTEEASWAARKTPAGNRRTRAGSWKEKNRRKCNLSCTIKWTRRWVPPRGETKNSWYRRGSRWRTWKWWWLVLLFFIDPELPVSEGKVNVQCAVSGAENKISQLS